SHGRLLRPAQRAVHSLLTQPWMRGQDVVEPLSVGGRGGVGEGVERGANGDDEVVVAGEGFGGATAGCSGGRGWQGDGESVEGRTRLEEEVEDLGAGLGGEEWEGGEWGELFWEGHGCLFLLCTEYGRSGGQWQRRVDVGVEVGLGAIAEESEE